MLSPLQSLNRHRDRDQSHSQATTSLPVIWKNHLHPMPMCQYQGLNWTTSQHIWCRLTNRTVHLTQLEAADAPSAKWQTWTSIPAQMWQTRRQSHSKHPNHSNLLRQSNLEDSLIPRLKLSLAMLSRVCRRRQHHPHTWTRCTCSRASCQVPLRTPWSARSCSISSPAPPIYCNSSSNKITRIR